MRGMEEGLTIGVLRGGTRNEAYAPGGRTHTPRKGKRNALPQAARAGSGRPLSREGA